MEQAVRKQQSLAPAAVTALQDLRLFAAVELAYFTAKGRYGTVDDLKSTRFLSAAWPRSYSGDYRIDCAVDAERGFACYADPATAGKPYFRIDATQSVGIEHNRRPDSGSPLFQ